METEFESEVKGLYETAYKIINSFLKKNPREDKPKVIIPQDFAEEFMGLIDKVSLSLMDDKDNFYGYFLFQMSREIRFDISSPTAVNFQGSNYVIYFNPIIFLTLTIQQMESSIKHEILHVLSMHLGRAKEFKTGYKKVAVNMAMDVVVNTYLDYLPPYATTLEWVNLNYSLHLLPFEPFEYYVERIQSAIELLEVMQDDAADEENDQGGIETEYNPATTHNIWAASSDVDEQTLREFNEKFIEASQKGNTPYYLAGLISALRNSKAELPWNLYLQRLVGAIASQRKKTITRRNRRQPERLDLRGQLMGYKAKIAVALDISGSITDAEFCQAVKEVFGLVKNYHNEITIIECDSEIRRVYKAKAATDIKERLSIRGGTCFTPVFDYANTNKMDLLIYFTDGKGEAKLLSAPKGYKILWVISGNGDKLSLKESYGVVKKLNKIAAQDHILDINDVEKGGYSMNNHEKIHI